MAGDAWTAAEPYEPFMGRWSRILATSVVDGLAPAHGLRWLDVGCGTGALSAALIEQAAPASVVAIDPSPDYLAAARARLDDPRVTVLRGSAGRLPVPDDSAERVAAGLVLNFTDDPVEAVREMRRVLVPGGRATAYVWDYANGMQMLRRFWDAATVDDPTAADLDEGMRFPLCRPDALRTCFAEAGMVELVTGAIEIATTFADFDDYWTPFLGGQGPAPGYCATLTPHAREVLRGRLKADLPTDPEGTIRLTALAWVVTGTSP